MEAAEYEFDPLIAELAEEEGMEYHTYVDSLIQKLDDAAARTRNSRLGIEPEGIDLIIKSKNPTEKERKQISQFITKSKKEHKAMTIIETKRKDKKKTDKQSDGFVLPKS